MLPMLDQMVPLLAKPHRPRCVIIGDGFESVVVAHIAAARLGLRIPDDLVLGGYHSWRCGELGWQGPMLEQRWDHMAKAAVDLVMTAIKKPTERIPAQAIPLQHIGFI